MFFNRQHQEKHLSLNVTVIPIHTCDNNFSVAPVSAALVLAGADVDTGILLLDPGEVQLGSCTHKFRICIYIVILLYKIRSCQFHLHLGSKGWILYLVYVSQHCRRLAVHLLSTRRNSAEVIQTPDTAEWQGFPVALGLSLDKFWLRVGLQLEAQRSI